MSVIMVIMKKVLFMILPAGAVALMLAQQPQPVTETAPGRIATSSTSPAGIHAPYEVLSIFPEESAAGEYKQIDPTQLQALSGDGWQLVSVAPYAYRNEGHAASGDPTLPPPPLVTQVYLAYFFQRARLIH